jgi:hypothetical protein
MWNTARGGLPIALAIALAPQTRSGVSSSLIEVVIFALSCFVWGERRRNILTGATGFDLMRTLSGELPSEEFLRKVERLPPLGLSHFYVAPPFSVIRLPNCYEPLSSLTIHRGGWARQTVGANTKRGRHL